ncbi:hypothetical protein UFOVP466_63 [uncultured Caudovirales phage]|uniref:Uncharacterized protein n=1 Tax=uncultured Caudovirales phage TaxID=2100421 RepID=A0A6J5Q9M7_9CAUD|nr:hypothetical protein UFOVP466_63 [uncultured Caudovirales phage]CAB4180212.1 hypothetical protein UFOVP1045_10 [uncultured Caudovirales phage]CAB4190478.1 hypothetical protein UFOVP1194_64 [uncultured Caudovirales phage]CAB4221823.1 hypothetical protein UFOVP1641_60 [uncultured Caudovirales phage]
MGTPAVGVAAKMAFDTALPFDTSSIPMEFESCSVKKTGRIIATDGMRGTRQLIKERSRNDGYDVAGTIVMAVTPLALDQWLPLILGKTGASVELSETLESGAVMVDFGTKVFTWAGVYVSKATFRAQQGKVLMMSLDIVAKTEAVSAAGGFPALTMPVDLPYVLADAVVTEVGTAREVSEIEIVIDNQLDTGRAQNSLTRTSFPSQGVMITLSTNHPYSTSEVDLYDQSVLGSAGSVVFMNAASNGKVLTFSFANLQAPSIGPDLGSKGEIRLPVQYTARRTVADAAVVITNANA